MLFTNTTVEKMKDILRNAKINLEGVIIMKADFQKIASTFAEYTEDIYYNELYNLTFLLEIFTASEAELNDLVPKLEREQKVELDLIKIVVKKRNGIKK